MQEHLVLALLAIAAWPAVMLFGADELAVLPKSIDGVPPHDMMKQYLLRQVEQARQHWQTQYDQLQTPEQIAAYQKRLREKFIEAIGGLPERTPLNPQVTGVLRRDGYRVEKVVFESQPKCYVTAALFLAEGDRHKPPHPGVLVPCGHAANAKAHVEYQTMGALLALNGMVALVFDPIEQGERSQVLDAQGRPTTGGVTGHTMIAVGSILLGQHVARFEIWDAMRAVDYLQSRAEVDPRRIGCTGNSGGGTQTSYMMALDDRISAAAPSCYICNFPTLLRTIGPQDAEQNIHGQLAFGMDHPDYLMMRAPTPILICAATKDFFDINGTWESFRYAKRLYTRMGFAERVAILENDAPHNYDRLQREGAARWMARWLLGRDEAITEPEIKTFTDEELQCTPRGQVMLLEGARSVYELNEDAEKELAGRRRQLWAEAGRAERLQQVRQIAGIRSLDQLPTPKVENAGTVQREGYRIEKLMLKPEEGICLAALKFVPAETKPGPAVLYVHENGKAADTNTGGAIEGLVKAGRIVLAVDLRGTGETQQTEPAWAAKFGPNLREVLVAYLLDRSYVGMRAEDVLICARHAAAQASSAETGGVDLVAVGNVGVPALHAAALEPQLFTSVRLVRSLASWSGVLHSRITRDQLVNVVHGALRVYDLPDLAATLGDRLTIEQPVDANGQPVRAGP